jgi:hypothetical protein
VTLFSLFILNVYILNLEIVNLCGLIVATCRKRAEQSPGLTNIDEQISRERREFARSLPKHSSLRVQIPVSC